MKGEKADEGADGEDGHNECYRVSNGEEGNFMCTKCTSRLVEFEQLVSRRSKHCGDGKKEREFGSGLLRKLLSQAPDNGSGRPGDSGRHGKRFKQANLKSGTQRNVKRCRSFVTLE